METETKKETINKKRNRLWNSYKGIFGQYNSPANFKEPVLFLMRRGKRVDFIEGVKSGTFEYKHTDGEYRSIILHPSNIRMFPNGKKMFEGYICHEDEPLPLPQDPVITAETVGITIDKTLHDVKKWKSSEYNAKGNMWKQIITSLAILLAIYLTYLAFFKKPVSTQIIQQAAPIVEQAAVTIL